MKKSITAAVMALGLMVSTLSLQAQEIHEYMDLQAHGSMHIPWPFFKKALTWIPEGKTPKQSHKHTFRNVMYADYYKENQGSRIIINGALVGERATSKKQATRLMLKQIEYINNIAKNNPEYFAVATTPAQVRELIHTTNKTVFVHSIEGARKLLDGPEDAKFWAKQGVAFITLIHLLDDEYGHSAITPDGITPIINLGGTLSRTFHKNKRRGLSEKGKKAIVWLADAGILTDLTHMAPESVDDALEVMTREQIPPLHTHSFYQPLQNHDRGLTAAQLVKTYQLGGLFSTPIGGNDLFFHKPTDEGKAIIAAAGNYCADSLDNYVITFNAVQAMLKNKQQEIFQSLEQVRSPELELALGWQSDFNGWVNHSRPKYGKKGCIQDAGNRVLSAVDTAGLAHPGMLPEYWQHLEQEGMDTHSLRFASEKFLQMWEKMLERALVK